MLHLSLLFRLERAAEITRKKALDELESGLKFQATLDIEQVNAVPSWLAYRHQGEIVLLLWFWLSPFRCRVVQSPRRKKESKTTSQRN